MGPSSANPYIPDLKARISLLTPLLDPKNPNVCPQASIKAAIGFYDTGYDGIATIYLVDGRRVNSLSEAPTPQGTSVDRSKSNVVSKF